MQRGGYNYPSGSARVDAKFTGPLGVSSGGAGTLLTLFGDPASVATAESFLRRGVDGVTAYTDETTLTANTFPFTTQWPGTRKLVLSHSLMPNGGNMASYAAGTFNSTYQTCATNLIPYRDRIIAIRIGWEFNAPNIYPWCVGGSGTNQTTANYIGAFQQFARILKTTLPEIPIDWCPLADNALADPWYPGDDYVDIIGVDQYMNSAFWSDSFGNTLFSMNNGLKWQEAFAATRGKMMGWAEWGTDYNTGTWLTSMAQWLKQPRQTRVLYQGYWDSDLGFTSALATHPVNKAAYIAAFAQ